MCGACALSAPEAAIRADGRLEGSMGCGGVTARRGLHLRRGQLAQPARRPTTGWEACHSRASPLMS